MVPRKVAWLGMTLCAVSLGRAATHDVLGPDSWKDLPAPIMGAEDFSYILEQVPGAMFFLGVAPNGEDWSQCCGIHSSRMMVDETALPLGTAVLAGCAVRFLEQGFE
jgi:metal-dependent amidase/aminoacylase/carboxypeptidase family protein